MRDSISGLTRCTRRENSQRLARRDDVAVHHVQRIAGLPHVQPGERAPGAADRVEGAALAVPRAARAPAKRLAHDLLGLLERLLREVLQREAAERQRDAVAQPDGRARRPVRASRRRDRRRCRRAGRCRTPRRAPRARASRVPDSTSIALAADALRRGDEVAAVARRRGRRRWRRTTAARRRPVSHSARKRRSAAERLLDRIGGEQAGRLHLAAEAGQHLFVEDRRRRSASGPRRRRGAPSSSRCR